MPTKSGPHPLPPRERASGQAASKGNVSNVIRNNPNVQRFLLVVVSIIFVLFCLELPVLIGVVDYRSISSPYFPFWRPSKADPELVTIHRPHTHKSGSFLGGNATFYYQIPESDKTRFHWDLQYDHNGFRNQIDLKSADMVVIGDSFVEAMTVSNAELVTSRLAQLQGKVVANLGQSGYGPLQELVVLRRYGLSLRPHTVVWMFFEGNDLMDVIFYQRRREHPPAFWHFYWDRSLTKNAYKAIRQRVAPRGPKPPGMLHSCDIPTSNGSRMRIYFTYATLPFSRPALGALDQTVLTLATAYKLCAAQGARLIVVFVPMKFRVLHDLCEFPPESECSKWTLNDLPERFQRAVRSISPDLGYVDLTPYLVEAAKTEALPYNPDDEHWSPEGHKVAAQAINHYLASSGSP